MKKYLISFFLGVSLLVIMGAKITSDILKIGNKVGEDISIVFDIGNGTVNPLIRWNDATSAIQFTNDGSNFFDVGSGAGGGSTNYVDNSDFEAGIVTGVTGTTIDLQENIVTPLFGGRSLQAVSQSSIGDIQLSISGIDAGVIDKFLTNLVEIDLRTDNLAADGDYKICVWRTSGTPACVTELTDIPADSEIRHRVPFTPLTGDTYTIKISFTDTTAGRVIDIDRAIFTPDSNSGLIGLDTSWASYTPTGSWTTNTTYTGRFRQVADSIDMEIRIELSGAPDAVALTVDLPSGLTIDDSKLTTSDANNRSFGTVNLEDQGTGTYAGFPGYFDTNSLNVFTFLDIGTLESTSNVTHNFPVTWTTNDSMIIKVWGLPIAELANNKINLLTQSYITSISRLRNTITTSAVVNDSNVIPAFGTIIDNEGGGFTKTSADNLTFNFDGWVQVSGGFAVSSGSALLIIDPEINTVSIPNEQYRVELETRIDINTTLKVSKGDVLRFKNISGGSRTFTDARSLKFVRVTDSGSFDVGGFAQATETELGLTNVATATQAGSVPSFSQGTYTPSLTNLTNITGPSASLASFFQIGQSVTVWGKFNNVNPGSGDANMHISLPVGTANFTGTEQGGGGGLDTGTVTPQTHWLVTAANGADRVVMNTKNAGDPASQDVVWHFHYRIQ